MVSSFRISSPRISPSWPCEVNGSSAASHITPMSSPAALIARTARQTTLSGSTALPPCGSLSERSEEHTSELQSLMRISYAVFCLKKKKTEHIQHTKRQQK